MTESTQDPNNDRKDRNPEPSVDFPGKEEITRKQNVAPEDQIETSNGNRESLDDTKVGGSAQRGGPGIEKAIDRMPPDSTRPFSDDQPNENPSPS